jgi:alkyldihydroxyacetonephosphate synthase
VAEGCALVVLDEADPGLLGATLAVVDAECAGAARLDDSVVARWLEHRNDVSALGPLWEAGVVVDTAEVSAPWRALPALAVRIPEALGRLEGTIAATVHQSHAYLDGACLYFTFAGQGPQGPDPAWQDGYYRRAWDALCQVALDEGAALSHHHGIGLSRGRFAERALGAGHGVLATLKHALDPAGILNPGKLGLDGPFGEVPWP